MQGRLYPQNTRRPCQSTDFLLTDQVGSLRAVADTSGTIVKRIDYDSFGNIIADTNPAFTVPFGFAGGLHDRDTGLVRFGYRDYSPELGRWTAKDPIDFAGGDTNLYAYTMSDPINLTDPSGLTWGENASYFWKWATGQPMPTDFGPGSNQVNDMKNAPGVQKAREAFYRKNAGKACGGWEPLTNYKADFGLSGLWNAGLNPTQQFVGSYRVDITPNPNGTININLTNATSFTSFTYGRGPSWNGGPGGTQTQSYHWTE